MTAETQRDLLADLLDSWDRNNKILLGLLSVLPEGGLDVRAMAGGPTVAQLFTHLHYVRLVFVEEDAPEFATRKARHAAAYRSPSKKGQDAIKAGNVDVLAFPDFFPNQGGVPIIVDGQTLGGISASGAKSEIDEAIAQAGADALVKK